MEKTAQHSIGASKDVFGFRGEVGTLPELPTPPQGDIAAVWQQQRATSSMRRWNMVHECLTIPVVHVVTGETYFSTSLP